MPYTKQPRQSTSKHADHRRQLSARSPFVGICRCWSAGCLQPVSVWNATKNELVDLAHRRPLSKALFLFLSLFFHFFTSSLYIYLFLSL
ncbi:uncharacterized protein EURHEDRAFT_360649 [Aspergillus ruber CBS 135680]|uniref:Uncharacterized protein n=1 Tax=Aspergillus ruber (strain CBS 135680) TaxID=1388766 RepID=A0A017SGM7_ASPRC|nr:uncharacterized protein EURHEDRAFT_360649 [Aspergillus ruber CBS 135680]EYE96082.1 hypothetical protein EURHEDRAFT_360649 [Aspergillus ruber CBS 135680]